MSNLVCLCRFLHTFVDPPTMFWGQLCINPSFFKIPMPHQYQCPGARHREITSTIIDEIILKNPGLSIVYKCTIYSHALINQLWCWHGNDSHRCASNQHLVIKYLKFLGTYVMPFDLFLSRCYLPLGELILYNVNSLILLIG